MSLYSLTVPLTIYSLSHFCLVVSQLDISLRLILIQLLVFFTERMLYSNYIDKNAT